MAGAKHIDPLALEEQIRTDTARAEATARAAAQDRRAATRDLAAARAAYAEARSDAILGRPGADAKSEDAAARVAEVEGRLVAAAALDEEATELRRALDARLKQLWETHPAEFLAAVESDVQYSIAKRERAIAALGEYQSAYTKAARRFAELTPAVKALILDLYRERGWYRGHDDEKVALDAQVPAFPLDPVAIERLRTLEARPRAFQRRDPSADVDADGVTIEDARPECARVISS